MSQRPSIDLPAPVAAYFAADKLGGDAAARCFTNGAVVKDEGHTYRGRAAITQWKAGATAKYAYTSEPVASEQQGETTIVTSRLTGNFPGSPLSLRYFFRLERGKIVSLEIRP
jgi:hypothetical protein